jgi:alpha-beta hydrolase superfamily lysophospholipase
VNSCGAMSEVAATQSTFESTFDSTKIFFRAFKHAQPTFAMYLIHGLSEHSERYAEFATQICRQLRANVFVVDHRAHGRTSCPSGSDDLSHLGDFSTTKDKAKLDCLEVMGGDALQLIHETSGDLPIFIFGHSMGSVIARWCLKLAPEKTIARIKGVILSGIPTVPSVIERLPLLIIVKSAIALGTGRDSLHRFIIGKFDNEVRQKTKNKQLPRSCFISSVLQEVEKFNSDPLCGQTVDLHIWKSMRSSLIGLESPDIFFKSLGDKRMPVLFISGKNDPVCAYGKTSIKCAKGMSDMGFPVTELFLDDCRHEFLYEIAPVKQKGIEFTQNWIISKL